MFEAALFASIVTVVVSTIWSIVYIHRIRIAGVHDDRNGLALRLPAITFILANLLYVLPLPIRLLFTKEAGNGIASDLLQFVEYFPAAIILDALFLVLFAFVFRLTAVGSRLRLSVPIRIRHLSMGAFVFLWIPLATTCAVLIVGLAKSAGGVLSLVLMGYGATSIFIGNGLYAIGIPWLMSLSVLLLVYMRMRNSRFGQLAAMALIAIEIGALILMARRGALVGFGISLLVVWHFLFRRFTLKSLALILFSGFLAMNLLGLLRGSSYTSISNALESLNAKGDSVSSDGQLKWFYTLTSGNFVVPFQTMPSIMSHVGSDIQLQFGATTVRAVALVVPRALWADRPEPLANWYMRKFVDHNAQDNEGIQFFFLSGSYLNFWIFGPILWAILYGTVMGWLCIWFSRRLDSAIHLSLFALVVGNTLNAIASDTFGGAVTFTRVIAAPCLLFLAVSIIGHYRRPGR
ncbi:MAG: hypothetical protein ABI114_11430 [Rhodanobacter sp.]